MSDENPPPAVPGGELDRLAQPVDTEQPPRLPFPVVGVGASAGGIEAFGEFLTAMRPDSGMAFVFILHLPPDHKSLLPDILARRTAMPVAEVTDGMPVEPDRVYVIRPGHVLTVRDGALHLGPKLGGPRAADRPVDDLFRSLAEEQRERAICVVMSGMGSNGTAGAQAVKAVGGLCVAQDPDSAQFPSMPRHLIDAGYADYIARPTDLPDILLTYATSPYARGAREADAAAVLEREQQHLREVLAILRTRTKQDFTGYKKPTLLRRVQRRMGLTRTATLAEYARLLRQTPGEVTALADDLLIHVTGFFRDPEAWEALRERVVAPLVEAREPGGPVRAWVTACSSGEEAYSLAMLLTEESERAGKRLDIKVFATDLAERALAHARAGVYPGGIESEIPPERLARFFAREDEVYRVRQDLRDRVVFAPQNILQDPPFSRLDIASCRNLLIYLEPEVQQRVLALLHFGLREGGALFLGTSETVTGAEDMFEPLDRKARIYRRVGPTRHGTIEFPLPRALSPAEPSAAPAPPVARRPSSRAALAEFTRQVLLEHHTPPAVTVDRDGHILYYHGDTRPFLQQLSGEPTRDLMLLARDGVRGAVRVALHRAADENRRAAADGWLDTDADRRVRVRVTVSPVADTGADRSGAPDFYVVGFEDRGEVAPAAPAAAPGAEASEELRRLRGELQSTIEELQTSNEELKASNEEVMSINEELQSANEELETSKEELQSLNEELRTVNAQLRAKMEEHQATSSDLSSLLTSTDIAVLFLDTALRIRRFTPAVRDLLDLIPTDVGRPLAALARKFDDPGLDDDCRAVLERLVPVVREVSAASGRHYLRRVLPYRTTDNRIDGAVVTFVDVTERKRAEQALAEEKEYAESIVETLHEPVLVLHPDLTVKGVNPAFYTHFRVDPADTVGRKVYELGNGQWNIPALRTLLEDVLPDSNVFNDYEVTHEFESIGRRVMLVNGRRLDHVQLILLGIRDITDRKADEEAVRASEEKYRTLFESIDSGFAIFEMIYDPSGAAVDFRYAETNPAFERQAGRRPRPGQTMRELFPEAEDMWLADYAEVDRTGRPKRFVDRVAGLDRWYDVFVFPAAGGGRLAALFRDVTDQKRAEDALRSSEERYRALVESQVEMVAQFRPDGTLLFVNQAYARAFGKTPDELTGTSFWGLIPPEEHAGVRARLDALTPDAPQVQIENMVSTPDGPRWTLWTNRALAFDAAGRVTEAQSVGVDITDRKRVEAALRASEERLRLALSAARMGVWGLDTATGMQTRDGNLNRLLGLDPVGTEQPFDEFLAHVHPDDRAAVRDGFAASDRESRPLNLEFRVIRPDGSVRWLRDQGDVFGSDGERRMTGACVDVTDLKDAEAAVRAGEERYRLILASATDHAIFTLNPDRAVTDWSPGAEFVFGFPAAEMIGRSGDELFTPEDRAAGAPAAEVEAARRDGRATDERWHLRKGGERFFASGALTPLAGGRGFVKVLRDLTERKWIEDELLRTREQLQKSVSVRTAELAAALDSLETEMLRRNELARRLSTAQEEERQRLARDLHDTVGQTLTGLALAAAAGQLEQVRRLADELSRELHDVAVRLRPTALDDLGLAAAARELVAEWSARAKVPVDFQAVGAEALRLPREIETALYRVVQEALTNVARYAGATRVSVVVGRREEEAVAVIEDDGFGFDPEAVPRTPVPGRRGGLGLVGMRERVELLGGALEVDSAPGAGTTVIARIPLAGTDPAL